LLPARLIRALCRSAKTEAVTLTQVEGQKQNASGSFRHNNSLNASGNSLDVIRKVEGFSQFFPPR
jgi:hypothetical protein